MDAEAGEDLYFKWIREFPHYDTGSNYLLFVKHAYPLASAMDHCSKCLKNVLWGRCGREHLNPCDIDAMCAYIIADAMGDDYLLKRDDGH